MVRSKVGEVEDCDEVENSEIKKWMIVMRWIVVTEVDNGNRGG